MEYRKQRTPEIREANRSARYEYAWIRREAEQQCENGLASKAKSESKLLQQHQKDDNCEGSGNKAEK